MDDLTDWLIAREDSIEFNLERNDKQMKCTEQEQATCNVEKMGCAGCYYEDEEIKVGEYVRTNKGLITKVKNIEKEKYEDGTEETFIETELNLGYLDFTIEEIVKHSKQLINLIENKDILKIKNNGEILFIGVDENTLNIKYKEIIEELKNGEYQLLEILAHEQFEANCYKIGGKQ